MKGMERVTCRGRGIRVTPVKLLLADDLVPIAEELCALLGVPITVVSAAPAWDGPVHRIVQIDLPGLHARVFADAARLRGVSMEGLVAAWIERGRAELAGDGEAVVLRTCRRMAEWERLGYTGRRRWRASWRGRSPVPEAPCARRPLRTPCLAGCFRATFDSMDNSLELRVGGRIVFASAGRWLHPLFELGDFLAAGGIDVSGGIDAAAAELCDKVVGRGSAFLIVRLGIRRVHAVLLSSLGKDVLDQAGVAITWDTLVDRIACATESLLDGVTDVDEAYRILLERRAAAIARKR